MQDDERGSSVAQAGGAPEFDGVLINAVAQLATLESICLTGMFLSVADDGPISDPELRPRDDTEAAVSVSGSWDVDREAGVLSALVRYSVGSDPQAAPYEGDFFIGVEYRATYDLDEVQSLSDEALECFAVWNGQLNTWPYFREFTQSIAARADLGTLLLPLFRAPKEG